LPRSGRPRRPSVRPDSHRRREPWRSPPPSSHPAWPAAPAGTPVRRRWPIPIPQSQPAHGTHSYWHTAFSAHRRGTLVYLLTAARTLVLLALDRSLGRRWFTALTVSGALILAGVPTALQVPGGRPRQPHRLHHLEHLARNLRHPRPAAFAFPSQAAPSPCRPRRPSGDTMIVLMARRSGSNDFQPCGGCSAATIQGARRWA
jgi:hypothetical protein